MLIKKNIYIFTEFSYAHAIEYLENISFEFDLLVQDPSLGQYFQKNEKKLDELASVIVSPKLPEIEFDCFEFEEKNRVQYETLFNKTKTTFAIENLPYLEVNPFQVSWLKLFFKNLGECLIDVGGMELLEDRLTFLERLENYKDLSLFKEEHLHFDRKPLPVRFEKTPLDFVIDKLNLEIIRLKNSNLEKEFAQTLTHESLRNLYNVYLTNSGINSLWPLRNKMDPKKFGDLTEKLYFLVKNFKN